jgi:hypothetical protein
MPSPVRRRPSFWIEEILQYFLTIVENSREIGRHEQFLHQLSSGNCVGDAIANNGSNFVLAKSVLVDPKAIGSPDLPVDKTMGWLPDRVFALPTQGDAVEAKTVIDQHAGFHLQRQRSQDFKVQPSGSEILKVLRIGKEGKYHRLLLRQPNFCLEFKSFDHGFAPLRLLYVAP